MPTTKVGYVKCPNCGVDNREDGGLTRLCMACGAPLKHVDEVVFQTLSVTPASTAAWPCEGVDISEYQGNWEIQKTIDMGKKFAILRGGFGNAYVDVRFEENRNKAAKAGFPFGVYHVSNPNGNWEKQAAFAVKLAADAPVRLWMDDEIKGDLSNDALGNWLAKYTNAIDEQYSDLAGIYTRASWWNAYVPRNDWAKKHPLWIAHYTSASQPLIPNDWGAIKNPETWKKWQWSADGNGEGAAHGVQSVSIDKTRYHGTVGEFMAEYHITSLPVPEPTPEPEPEPEPEPFPAIVQVAGLGTNEQLNLRATPYGTIIAKTWNGATFAVEGTALDVNGKVWYFIGKSICVASWYTIPA